MAGREEARRILVIGVQGDSPKSSPGTSLDLLIKQLSDFDASDCRLLIQERWVELSLFYPLVASNLDLHNLITLLKKLCDNFDGFVILLHWGAAASLAADLTPSLQGFNRPVVIAPVGQTPDAILELTAGIELAATRAAGIVVA